jgi:NuA3 HAT complex component NTO1
MNPKEKLNLPKPSTRQVETFKAYEESEGVKVNYVDRTMASIGYQESEIFARPEKALIRVPEGSIEEDLDLTLQSEGEGTSAVAVGRVEYDMDEQDDCWLETVNFQRREEGVEPIKPAIFEVTITQIEKEWHALEKRKSLELTRLGILADLITGIPKPNPKPPQTHRPRSSSAAAVNGEPVGQGDEQDTKCAVCDDGDCENTNAIVFCDGCDLAVHQECYGVPFIPEGQWLCRRCQLVGRGTPVSEQPVWLNFSCCIHSKLTLIGLHFLSEYRWCFQTNHGHEMGASALCYVDSRSISSEYHLSGARARCRKGAEDSVEAGTKPTLYITDSLLTSKDLLHL